MLKRLLPFAVVLSLAAPAAAGGTDWDDYQRPAMIKVECDSECCDTCKPGRAVGASLGVAGSVAALAVGSAFMATGFNQDRVDDQLRRQQRGWGVTLTTAGIAGLITSAIAVKRNRDSRKAKGCAPGVFRSK